MRERAGGELQEEQQGNFWGVRTVGWGIFGRGGNHCGCPYVIQALAKAVWQIFTHCR